MITPIEMYTMVPKSHEVANQRMGEQARDSSLHAGITQAIEQNANDNSQRTVRMSEAANPDFKYDAKEKGNNEYSSDGERKKNGEREKQEQGIRNVSTRPGGIDIRI